MVRAQRIGARFYAVADPAPLRRRVPLRSVWPCLLYVIAQRVQEVDLASLRPQQSDYTAAWQRGQVGSTASSRLRRYVPHALQEPLVELRSTLWSLTRFAPVCNDFQAVRLDRLGHP